MDPGEPPGELTVVGFLPSLMCLGNKKKEWRLGKGKGNRWMAEICRFVQFSDPGRVKGRD